MAFSPAQRVIVSSLSSVYYNQMGTVEKTASQSIDGLNKVRLDGHPVGRVVNMADQELKVTSFASPIQY